MVQKFSSVKKYSATYPLPVYLLHWECRDHHIHVSDIYKKCISHEIVLLFRLLPSRSVLTLCFKSNIHLPIMCKRCISIMEMCFLVCIPPTW